MEAHRNEKFASNILDYYEDSSMNAWLTVFGGNIKDTFEDELADAVIRIFDLAEHLNVDREYHIKAKMKYNLTRPFKHGVKY